MKNTMRRRWRQMMSVRVRLRFEYIYITMCICNIIYNAATDGGTDRVYRRRRRPYQLLTIVVYTIYKRALSTVLRRLCIQ